MIVTVNPNGRSEFRVHKQLTVTGAEDVHANYSDHATQMTTRGNIIRLDASVIGDIDWLKLEPEATRTHYLNVSAGIVGKGFDVDINIYDDSMILLDTVNYQTLPRDRYTETQSLALQLNAHETCYIEVVWNDIYGYDDVSYYDANCDIVIDILDIIKGMK